jgi:hypothetical protein
MLGYPALLTAHIVSGCVGLLLGLAVMWFDSRPEAGP